MNLQEIPKIIESDVWMMQVLRAVRRLSLSDCWIGAGFVRNKVWDELHAYKERTTLSDIDVVYFDRTDLTEESEELYQERLENILPTGKWSVTNQARMHEVNNDAPYTSSLDAICKWPETATAVAVTLGDDGQVIFEAPLGADDLIGLVVRPTFAFEDKMDQYRSRARKKNWSAKWPKLRIIGG